MWAALTDPTQLREWAPFVPSRDLGNVGDATLTMIGKVAAGWHICLVVADRLLAGHPIGPTVGDDAMQYGWQDLRAQYADRLGLPGTDST